LERDQGGKEGVICLTGTKKKKRDQKVTGVPSFFHQIPFRIKTPPMTQLLLEPGKERGGGNSLCPMN